MYKHTNNKYDGDNRDDNDDGGGDGDREEAVYTEPKQFVSSYSHTKHLSIYLSVARFACCSVCMSK